MRRRDATAGDDRPVRLAAAILAAALVLAASAPASAQERRPAVGYGVPMLVLPVQAVSPAPGGMLPGGATAPSEARSRATSELDFAIAESEATSSWTGPSKITERAGNNPLLKADPVRLPVAGLERLEVGRDRVPDPLHGQIRGLAALTDARLVLVPTRLGYEAAPDSSAAASSSGGSSGEEADPTPAPGRAVLHVSLLDVRAGRVLWRGEVYGSAAPPGSSAAVATVASNLVSLFTP